MTERQLWDRFHARTLPLTNFGFTDMKSSEVRAIAREQLAIMRELRLRGTQLPLPLR